MAKIDDLELKRLKDNEARLLKSETDLRAKLDLITKKYGDLINDYQASMDQTEALIGEIQDLKHKESIYEMKDIQIRTLKAKLKIIKQLTKGSEDADKEIQARLGKHKREYCGTTTGEYAGLCDNYEGHKVIIPVDKQLPTVKHFNPMPDVKPPKTQAEQKAEFEEWSKNPDAEQYKP